MRLARTCRRGVGSFQRHLVLTLGLMLMSAGLAQSLVVYPLAGQDVLLGVAVAERIAAAYGDEAQNPGLEVYGPEVAPGLSAPLVTRDGFASLLGLLSGEDERTTDSPVGAVLLRGNLGADAVLTGRVSFAGESLRAQFYLATESGLDPFEVTAPEDEPGLLAQKAALLLAAKLDLTLPQVEYDIDLSSAYGDYVRALALVGGGFLDEALSVLEALGEEASAEAAELREDLNAVRLGEMTERPARLATMAVNSSPLDEALALEYFEALAAESELPVAETWQATLLASDGQDVAAEAAFAETAYPFGEAARAAYLVARDQAETGTAFDALLASDDVAALLGASLIAQLEGETATEKAALQRLTRLRPDYTYPFERLSFIAFDEDEPLAAAQALAVAVRQQPESDLYWTNLGWAYYLLDLFEQSQRASERAIALEPTQYIALYNLGLVHAVHGRLEDALAAYDQALALDPEVDDEAVLDLENARRRYPEEAAVHFSLATLYDQEGRRQEAALAYERYLDLEPQAPFERQAQTRLEVLRAPPPPLEISSGARLGLGPDLLEAETFQPGDRVYVAFELYTPGAELPPRVTLSASLRQDGATLAEQSLEVDIPRNAVGYVVDEIGFDLPRDLPAGAYRLEVLAEGSEERRAELQLEFEVTGSPSLQRQLLARGVVMQALESGQPLYSSRNLNQPDEDLLAALLDELERTATAAEEALPEIEAGRFEGLSGGELFTQSSAGDLRDFLEYLLAQGTEQASFTFVDAYAQWALDGAPSTDGEQ